MGFRTDGAVAQLGERYNRTVEAEGSIPFSSNIFLPRHQEIASLPLVARNEEFYFLSKAVSVPAIFAGR